MTPDDKITVFVSFLVTLALVALIDFHHGRNMKKAMDRLDAIEKALAAKEAPK